MAVKTHYDNLKVSRTASKAEIKQAYRKLCHKHHPDKYPEGEREKQNTILTIINEAYKVLSDDNRRAEHDEWIEHVELCERNARAADAEREEYSRRARERAARESAEREERERATRERNERRRQEEEREREEAIRRWNAERRQEKMEEERQKKERERQEDEIRRAFHEQMEAEAKEAERIKAAERIAKEAKKKARKEKRNAILTTIFFILIAIRFFGGSNDHKSAPSKPVASHSYAFDKNRDFIRGSRHDEGNVTVFDMYYNNTTEGFNYKSYKRDLKGKLGNEPVCQDPSFIKYQTITFNIHFTKDNKQATMHLEPGYLCF